MIRLLPTLVFCAVLAAGRVFAFDVVDQKLSHTSSKFMTLGIGLGMPGFAHDEGIRGGEGFAFRTTLGHHFNRYLAAEIVYQFATMSISSPDPISPGAELSTRLLMNQEYLRFILAYPALIVQPYVSAGFGGYNLYGIDQQTALSFPVDMQVPLSAGVRAYFNKNLMSFDLEYSYQFLFGENQEPDVLAILKVPNVSFNTYSIMATFTFHLW